jgi:MinD-like ATPase involved in chromosome partitioning or flagellar assembly
MSKVLSRRLRASSTQGDRPPSRGGRPHLLRYNDGAGLLQPVARGVLSTISAVVIVASASVDGARQAATILDWLRQNGYQHLVARSCVVINHLIPGKPGVDVADLVAQFQRYVAPGRVVVLPWDKHVASSAWTMRSSARRASTTSSTAGGVC